MLCMLWLPCVFTCIYVMYVSVTLFNNVLAKCYKCSLVHHIYIAWILIDWCHTSEYFITTRVFSQSIFLPIFFSFFHLRRDAWLSMPLFKSACFAIKPWKSFLPKYFFNCFHPNREAWLYVPLIKSACFTIRYLYSKRTV